MKLLLSIIASMLVLSGCCNLTSPDSNYQAPSQQYPSSSSASSAGQVKINNYVLTVQDKAAFRNYYGVEPQPGNYWYDSESGLYGKVGQSAAGYINPGHNFGALDPEASGGTSGTYLNGRELTYEELSYIESTYGVDWGQGDYYYNDQGYLGTQDSYVNTFDYYNYGSDYSDQYYGGGTDVYGSSGTYYGQIANDYGGGGDNFWSTNYGAGNSEGGCTYVNVGGDFASSGCG
jgi:hypothetical protein